MSSRVVNANGVPMAEVVGPGEALCLAVIVGAHHDRRREMRCPVRIQRAADGDLADGVRAHYKTVHPEKRLT